MNKVFRNISYSNRGAGLIALALGISVATLIASSTSLLVQLNALKKLSAEQKAGFSDELNKNTVVLIRKLISLRILQRNPKTLKWSSSTPSNSVWRVSSEALAPNSNGRFIFNSCDPRQNQSIYPNGTLPSFSKCQKITSFTEFNEMRPDGTQKIRVDSFPFGKAPRSLASLIAVPPSYSTITVDYQQFASGENPRGTDCSFLVDPFGTETLLGCNGDAQPYAKKSFAVKISADPSKCNTFRVMLKVVFPPPSDAIVFRDTNKNSAPNGQPEMNYMYFTKLGNSITGVLNDNEDTSSRSSKHFPDMTFTLTFPSNNFTIQNSGLACN